MVRIGRAIADSFPFIFAVLAFSFSLKAITSRDWASRNTYKSRLPHKNWTTPIFTSYRSPFIICDGVQTATKSPTNATILTYPLTCIHYKPFGFNATSCETVAVTKLYNLYKTGDARLCQQIHFTGNLTIAATVFIGLGFLLAILMTVLAFLQGQSSTRPTTASDNNTETVVKPKPERDVEAEINDPADTHSSHNHHHKTPQHAPPPPATVPTPPKSFARRYGPYFNAALILFLVLGAILYVLAQSYAVQAFTMSAPDNGRFASLAGNALNADGDNHDPWVQGKALTVFASLVWLCAGLSASMALLVWRLPTTGRTL
jgi:hypothetical protein